jgi:hypothetical protein
MRRIDHADADKIANMLNTRDLAKTDRNFALADEIASNLQAMDICYNDSEREWYPRAIAGSAEAKKSNAGQNNLALVALPAAPGEKKKRNKPPSWKKRSARQGLKNKLKKKGGIGGDTATATATATDGAKSTQPEAAAEAAPPAKKKKKKKRPSSSSQEPPVEGAVSKRVKKD